MAATLESEMRTRSFARVIGPFLTIVAGALELRAGEMGSFVSLFFENAVLVWAMGAALVLGGFSVIAFHWHWRSPAAVVISLLGCFVTLRGMALLYAPEAYARASRGVMAGGGVLAIRLGFSVMLLAGLWLSYVGWMTKEPGAGK